MSEKPIVTPFSLKDAPALIESVLPVQRLSIDVYKERMAGPGQTLTALGSYWKGRKPLVLNRACVLASLLPATENPKKDLEIFELLMGMDDESLRKRLDIRDDELLPSKPYSELSSQAKRAEEIWETVHTHIWDKVNVHLNTHARNYPQLVEQLGIMRFGHTPRIADTFSGSGQIPFEAARLGCNVYASDLNPIACMLTWSAFNIVGADKAHHLQVENEQKELIKKVKAEIDALGIETDGKGWRGKVYLYCLEVTCPSSGWKVPLLPTLVVSKSKRVIAELKPDVARKHYDIVLKFNVSDEQLTAAEKGTYRDKSLVHKVDGVEHRTKMNTIRGANSGAPEGTQSSKNRLRQWTVSDVVFRDDDIFNERLYAVQWILDDGSSRPTSEFRSVTADDLTREAKVTEYVQKHLAVWQAKGWVPGMRIESGEKTNEPIRTRGWTHWHHLFNPRQLFVHAQLNRFSNAITKPFVISGFEHSSRLCRWNPGLGNDKVEQIFSNQALNTIYNFGARGLIFLENKIGQKTKWSKVHGNTQIINAPAFSFDREVDVFITDPPYGDAVKYEEILEFFIAWIHKSPPSEFAGWVWDSRRALAVKGEDHDFKLSMVAAYKRMTECMPDNGLQIIMFTHQSGSIWADMSNIVWASGLQVTAAWYVVTETNSALRAGQHVKGTILLVLRKRLTQLDAARDELAYELAEEVKKQVDLLTGLNKNVKDLYRDENLFEDADLQMAGYAAALRVLTRYSTIDGVNMPQEAMRPRVKGQTTMVDELIAFAVTIANEYLVPEGVDDYVWEKSSGIARFYLKMLDMEANGIHILSNYQNFAKAFKVHDYGEVMAEVKANQAALKSAAQLGKRGMNATDEFGPTLLRSVLYAVHLLQENKHKSEDVLHQLRDLVPDYFRERERITALADYISKKTAKVRPDESSNAMVLRDLVRRERV